MVKKKKEGDVLKEFFFGMILFVVIQTVFMYGGFWIEKLMKIPVTGIPSAIGLTIVLFVGMYYKKKSEYVVLGSFALAFIAPLILLIVVTLSAMEFLSPQVYYSMGYMAAVILIVWGYYFKKISRSAF